MIVVDIQSHAPVEAYRARKVLFDEAVRVPLLGYIMVSFNLKTENGIVANCAPAAKVVVAVHAMTRVAWKELYVLSRLAVFFVPEVVASFTGQLAPVSVRLLFIEFREWLTGATLIARFQFVLRHEESPGS